jgi:hypothetical protein
MRNIEKASSNIKKAVELDSTKKVAIRALVY